MQADRNSTSKRRASGLKSGPDFSATMTRMRELAAQSGDALLLANGPVQPDAALLDLCAEALHLHRAAAAAETAFCEHRDSTFARCRQWTDAECAESDALAAEWSRAEKRMAPVLNRAKKIQATTPAGIYAKAQVVALSKTGALKLAMSLAADLLASPAIRAAIWPAHVEAAP